MNVVIGILQILLSIKFISVSYSHALRQDKIQMQEAIQKMGSSARSFLFVIASFSFLCSLGLILPFAVRIPAWTIAVIATILAVLSLLSIPFHIKYRKRPKIFAGLILFVIASFVAYARWFLIPLLK